MRARTLQVLLAVTLTGCAAQAPVEPPRPKAELTPEQAQFEREFAGGALCTSTYCSIAVTVGANCSITVSPTTLGVAASVEDAVLHWVIQPGASGTVAFTTNGINPKDAGAWAREFRNGARVSATEFTWVDKNKLAGAPPKRPYGYNVDVTQNGVACHKDPIIINDY
jgi:hypothetical protein